MSIEAKTNAVRSAFNTNITVAESIDTAWDNAPFTPPSDGSLWCRASVLFGQSFQPTCGSAKHTRFPGILAVQVFSPLEVGDKDALALADTIRGVFNLVTISEVVYGVVSIDRMGRDSGSSRQAGTGKWYQVNVFCPFYFDEFGS